MAERQGPAAGPVRLLQRRALTAHPLVLAAILDGPPKNSNQYDQREQRLKIKQPHV